MAKRFRVPMVPLLIRVPLDVHKALEEAAKERGVSMAFLVREALTLYLRSS